MPWQPSATIETLQKRAIILSRIRAFFAQQGVMEVEVPALSRTTVTDPHIESLVLESGGYLQTSPEYYMKRLLAAGSGSIYSLAKAYRSDETGRLHNPEFTMLEWYRLEYDDRQLADELLALIRSFEQVEATQTSYGDLFEDACALNPHRASVEQLREVAKSKLDVDWTNEPKASWLDLLFTHLVEPRLKGLTVIFDYPVCQSALAQIKENAQGELVARRFEVYWKGVELANGYWELRDVAEQKRRFESDCMLRKQMNKVAIEPDTSLLQALQAGLPACAGVALGVDRLLMCLLGKGHISQVMAFSDHS